MNDFLVEVTADDITQGESRNCSSCPVARAIRRALRAYSVRVYPSYFYYRIRPDGEEMAAMLPPSASAFVLNFDAGIAVRPYTFALDPARLISHGATHANS